jgi:hypothetical protein
MHGSWRSRNPKQHSNNLKPQPDLADTTTRNIVCGAKSRQKPPSYTLRPARSVIGRIRIELGVLRSH